MASYDFSGKKILVTGAGAGIGKVICQKLVHSNAQVIGLSLLQSELDELKREYPDITTVQVDLRDWAATRKVVQEIGPVYGLVNNAGIAVNAPFLNSTEEEIDLQYGVHVKATANVSQVFLKAMIDNKIAGSIVNISSTTAFVAMRGCTHYCGSKAAVHAMTKVWAVEFGKYGIRVNSICPSLVKTELSRPIWDDDRNRKEILYKTPLRRAIEATEVANAVAFLLSEDASGITGVALPVDGGYLTT